MKNNSDRFTWVSQPGLWLMNQDQVIMETEPFSTLFPRGTKPAAEIGTDVSNDFTFSICLQHAFTMPFDECGIILYNKGRCVMTAGIAAHDDMTNQMRCTVFHHKQGDISMRELGCRLEKTYFRLYCRANMVKVQYSFNGYMYMDMRKFWLEKPGQMRISLYACSPLNSSFDAVFSGILLEEGDGKNER